MDTSTENCIRELGKVKWFNNAKGYGFIEHPVQGDVFVYYQDILGSGFKTLKPQQQVEFTLLDRGRGPAATEVIPFEVAATD
ncbi:MAG: cold shock domain-containing protein [Gammaproteobacteria bacterium]